MKASEAQRNRFGGKVVWRCIRDIQREKGASTCEICNSEG